MCMKVRVTEHTLQEKEFSQESSGNIVIEATPPILPNYPQTSPATEQDPDLLDAEMEAVLRNAAALPHMDLSVGIRTDIDSRLFNS